MRTSLFLSTLFAVTLVGGAALAEKPQAAPSKEPRTIERLRAHGDTVDKVYRSADKARVGSNDGSAATADKQAHQNKAQIDKGASRVNCSSDSGVDCSAPKGADKANGLEASPKQTTRAARAPAFLDKILGSDRMSCNEGDECSMSNRAVKRAWSRAEGAKGDTATVPLASQKQVDRLTMQYQSSRMSCNEGDECSMSSKQAKKEWSYAAVKAGTWHGPAAEAKSPAAIRIEEQKASQDKKN